MTFLLSSMLGVSAIAAPAESFLKANEAYAAGDFKSAQRLYTEALKEKPDDNTWYNLGNTEFRLENPGHAALAYERALALSPHHAEAVENLRFLQQKTSARVAERSWPERMLAAVPPAVAPWLPVGVAWLGFAWGGAALWRRTGRTGLICGALLVLLGSAYGTGLVWWRSVQAREAVVIAASAAAKSEPSETSHTSETLPSGSRVKIVSAVSGWQYCQLPSGSRGWLPVATLESIILRARP